MASGMKVVVIAGDILHAQEIIGHGHMGKFPDFGVFGTGIERVGRMGNNFAEVMFCGETAVTGSIVFVDGFGFASSGISGEKLQGISIY